MFERTIAEKVARYTLQVMTTKDVFEFPVDAMPEMPETGRWWKLTDFDGNVTTFNVDRVVSLFLQENED